MDKNLFEDLLESANEALAHAKGKRDLRTTVLPPPPRPMGSRDVRRLRDRLEASQAVFAGYLNVSTKLVQAWEADRRTPEGAALRLLRLAEQAPELLLGVTPVVKRAATTRRKSASANKTTVSTAAKRTSTSTTKTKSASSARTTHKRKSA